MFYGATIWATLLLCLLILSPLAILAGEVMRLIIIIIIVILSRHQHHIIDVRFVITYVTIGRSTLLISSE